MDEREEASPNQLTTMRCGHCGVPNAPDSIICATCGVLLAAYQSPAGAIAGDGPEHVSPSPDLVFPDPSILPDNTLPSLSAIDDLLGQSGIAASPEPATIEPAALVAGQDALAVAAMPGMAEPAREIEAGSPGAKVTFASVRPVVTVEPGAGIKMPGAGRHPDTTPSLLQDPAFPKHPSETDQGQSAGAIKQLFSLAGALAFAGIWWLVWQGRGDPRGALAVGLFFTTIVIWIISKVAFETREVTGRLHRENASHAGGGGTSTLRIALVLVVAAAGGLWVLAERMIVDHNDRLNWDAVWLLAATVTVLPGLWLLMDAVRRGRYQGWHRAWRLWESPRP